VIERVQGFVCSCIHGLLVACSMSWMAEEGVKANAGGHLCSIANADSDCYLYRRQEVMTHHALCEQIAHHREQNDEDRRYNSETR